MNLKKKKKDIVVSALQCLGLPAPGTRKQPVQRSVWRGAETSRWSAPPCQPCEQAAFEADPPPQSICQMLEPQPTSRA